MNAFLKVGHLVGLVMFLGSIFGHIVLSNLADPKADLAGFAVLMQAKYMNLLLLTAPGLVLMLLTGIPLMLRRGMTPNKFRWMGIKLALVTLIALNAAFILTPLSRDMAIVARGAVATGSLPADFGEMRRREDAFGAANIAMILAVIGLAVANMETQPLLRRRSPYKEAVQ